MYRVLATDYDTFTIEYNCEDNNIIKRRGNTMIYMRIMALLLSRANLDLHEGKNSHKKCSKASLQVIKSPWPQRLEVKEGRSKLCWKRRNAGQQKELWSSQHQGQHTVQPVSSPPPETNFQSAERKTDTGYDNYGGTHITNDWKWSKIRWVSVFYTQITTELYSLI